MTELWKLGRTPSIRERLSVLAVPFSLLQSHYCPIGGGNFYKSTALIMTYLAQKLWITFCCLQFNGQILLNYGPNIQLLYSRTFKIIYKPESVIIEFCHSSFTFYNFPTCLIFLISGLASTILFLWNAVGCLLKFHLSSSAFCEKS